MMNIKTGFGSEVHKGKKVRFVLHSRFGKVTNLDTTSPDFPFLVIPACMGIRTRISLDHLHQTEEQVTCGKCA